MRWLPRLVHDLRYTLRLLKRNPGFTTVVLLTLSVGIGMNAAVFSLLSAALLRPLPYPHPDRLVWVAGYDPHFERDTLVSTSDLLAWQAAQSFDAIAGYAHQDMALATGEEATQERITSVTGDFWTITGARPAWGRLLAADDPDSMVLSHELFERRFGSDPRVVGRRVHLDGRPVTIAGVLPKDFRLLFPQLPGREPSETRAYITLAYFQAPGQPGPPASVVARLRPGTALEQARAEMATIQSRAARERPGARPGERNVRVVTLEDRLVADFRRALGVLLAAVGFVLLIAVVNIANLMLARLSTRYREVAIRSAMGAGRGRLMQQLLTESVVLALLGGAAGLAVAHGGLALVLRLAPASVPRLSEATLDGRVLAFTILVSLGAGILFGLGPGLALRNLNLNEIMKGGGRMTPARLGRARIRGVLVAAELALGMILLTGACLMLKSFWRMHAAPAGFAPERILAMRVSLSGAQYRARPAQADYMQELLRRIQTVPGVESAGLDCGSFHLRATIEGNPQAATSAGSQDTQSIVSFRAVSPGYLRTMGVRLIRGQWPSEAHSSATNELLVNETFARGIAGAAGDAVGRHITAGIGTLGGVIVGVVSDFKYWRLDAEPPAEVYTSYDRSPVLRSVRIVARTSADPTAAAPTLRKLVADVDRTQPVYELRTLEQALAASITPRRFNFFLLGTFSLVALLLALVGIHGVVSHSVTERANEIGVRMALGAGGGDIVRMIVRQAMAFSLAGIALGLGTALGLTRLMAALLYDVKANDPGVFAVVALTMSATALLACWRPAARAARVDPLIALRHE